MTVCHDIEMLVGLDLFDKVCFRIEYPPTEVESEMSTPDARPVVVTPDPALENLRIQLLKILKPDLIQNDAIPVGSFCNHPSAVITLDTGSAVPVNRRQYPIPFRLQAVVDAQVQSWLDDGIIEKAPLDTPWNSPLLCVPKKDASGAKTSHRVCIDPRALNIHLADSSVSVASPPLLSTKEYS